MILRLWLFSSLTIYCWRTCMAGDTFPPSAGSFPPAWVRCRAAAPCPRSCRTRWCSPGWSSLWPWPGPRPAWCPGSVFCRHFNNFSAQNKTYFCKIFALPHDILPVIGHGVAEVHEVVEIHGVVLGLRHAEPESWVLWWNMMQDFLIFDGIFSTWWSLLILLWVSASCIGERSTKNIFWKSWINKGNSKGESAFYISDIQNTFCVETLMFSEIEKFPDK